MIHECIIPSYGAFIFLIIHTTLSHLQNHPFITHRFLSIRIFRFSSTVGPKLLKQNFCTLYIGRALGINYSCFNYIKEYSFPKLTPSAHGKHLKENRFCVLEIATKYLENYCIKHISFHVFYSDCCE